MKVSWPQTFGSVRRLAGDSRVGRFGRFLATDQSRNPWRRHLSGIFAALSGVALISWIIAWQELWQTIDNVAMLYLVIVVGAATIFGRLAALVASFAAVNVYQWLFISPIGVFRIGGPAEMLAFGVFLLVGLVTGELAAALRAQAEQARRREAEAVTLFRLSQALATAEGPGAIRQAIVEQARDSFQATGVILTVRPESGERLILARAGRPIGARLATFDPGPNENSIRFYNLPNGGQAASVPLSTFGTLLLEWARAPARLPAPSARIWRAFQNQAALSLERAWLTEESRQLEALRQRETFQSTLLATVSHDLRTPLATIKTLASDLQDPGVGRDPTTLAEVCATIDRETDRMNRLVSNLLDLSRLEAGVLQPRQDWYALDELVREVVDRFSIRQPGQPVNVTVCGDLVPVEVDDVQIDQVLTNLLENAARFAPPDSPIEVQVVAEPDAVRVEVLDRGPGFAAEAADRLFERFYRGPDAAGQAGLGLGLAICRGLIEAHGGQIRAEQRPGGGACFCFWLPAPAAFEAGQMNYGEPK